MRGNLQVVMAGAQDCHEDDWELIHVQASVYWVSAPDSVDMQMQQDWGPGAAKRCQHRTGSARYTASVQCLCARDSGTEGNLAAAKDPFRCAGVGFRGLAWYGL